MAHVGQVRQQVEGEVELNVPGVNIAAGMPLDDESLVALEGAVAEWTGVLSDVMQTAMGKVAPGMGPLAEI